MSTTTTYNSYDKPLSDLSSWQLEDSDQDIRGYKVYANPVEVIGVIEEMLVDKEAEVVSSVRLENGEIIPAADLTIGDGAVYLKNMYLTAPETPFVKVYES